MEPEKTPASQAGAASPLSGMLSALLSNPEMLRQIQAVFGNTASSAGTAGAMGTAGATDMAGATAASGTPSGSGTEGGAENDANGSAEGSTADSNLAGALGSLLAGLSAGAPPSSGDGSDSVRTGGIPADGLSAVLANPELMAKLPQVMAMLGPMLGGNEAKPPAPHHHHERSPEECRNDLLLALKPFLSPERRNAVDAIMRISKLGSVLRQMK